ncbi:MAG: serine hydrolase [Alphaproteobacteria bacterium]|nr:serine hydrolase [Alphaproteobacteria bacterium]
MAKILRLTALSLIVLGIAAAHAQIRIQPPQTPSNVRPNIVIAPRGDGPVIVTPAQPTGPAQQLAVPAEITGITVDQTRLSAHLMRPANILGITTDDGLDEPDAAATPRIGVASAVAPTIRRATPPPPTSSRPSITVRPGGIIITPPTATPRPGSRLPQLGTVRPGTIPQPGISPDLATPPMPHLDVNAFGPALHNALKDVVTGYVMRLIRNGTTIYTLQWNWSQTPADGSQGWNPNRNMHIASVSKLMTAIGMTRLLDEKNISYDTKIIGFLPAYWSKGANINQITFRHLLTHLSGFSTGGSSSDYQFMKSRVANGVIGAQVPVADDVIKVGKYDYENMNFGLCRILIAIINGNVPKNMAFPPFLPPGTVDLIWDYVTIQAYDQYIQDKVFDPSGVGSGSLGHPASGTLAYTFPANGSGWNSGDLSSMAGGAGWHMSTNDVLRVMSTFRRNGTIMSTGKAQAMLANMFGIDRKIVSPAGNLFEKNGRWVDNNGRTEQSVAYFLPGGMELVVFANSPVGPNGASLRNLVRDTYLANVVEP